MNISFSNKLKTGSGHILNEILLPSLNEFSKLVILSKVRLGKYLKVERFFLFSSTKDDGSGGDLNNNFESVLFVKICWEMHKKKWNKVIMMHVKVFEAYSNVTGR